MIKLKKINILYLRTGFMQQVLRRRRNESTEARSYFLKNLETFSH